MCRASSCCAPTARASSAADRERRRFPRHHRRPRAHRPDHLGRAAAEAMSGPADRSRACASAGLDEFFALVRASPTQRTSTRVAWIDCAGARAARSAAACSSRQPRRRRRTPGPPGPRRCSCSARRRRSRSSTALSLARLQRRSTTAAAAARRGDGCAAYALLLSARQPAATGTASTAERGFYQYQCVVPQRPGAKRIAGDARRDRRQRAGFLPRACSRSSATCRRPACCPFRGPARPRARLSQSRRERRWRCSIDSTRSSCAAGGALYPAKDARMSRRRLPRVLSALAGASPPTSTRVLVELLAAGDGQVPSAVAGMAAATAASANGRASTGDLAAAVRYRRTRPDRRRNLCDRAAPPPGVSRRKARRSSSPRATPPSSPPWPTTCGAARRGSTVSRWT